MGNSLAYLAIGLWPFLTLAFFDRLSASRAVIWAILGGYLLLPPVTAIAVPILPDIDKTASAALGALAGILLTSRDGRLSLPGNAAARWLMLLYVVVPLLSALTNGDPLTAGPRTVPGASAYDGLAFAMGNGISLVPMLLAGSVLGSAAGAERMLRAFAFAGLAYTVPMLMEVRLSPQLNVWIYGFFAHDFMQMIRYGGFRPMVFLTHGLWVALFAFTATAASAAMARAGGLGIRSLMITGYLFVVLVLCKSAASILYAAVVVPLILFASPRQQIMIAAGLAVLVIGYPLLRYGGLVPTDAIITFLNSIDPERAQSLEFRFDNETILLNHAAERMLLGWSGWGRNMVFDQVTGREVSITDGRWIITLGTGGLAGYLAEFGLLVLPVFLAMRRAGSCPHALAALTLIHAATLVDLLPNATLTPLSWLVAGVLLGAVSTVGAKDEALVPEAAVAAVSRGGRSVRVLLGSGARAFRDSGPSPRRARSPTAAAANAQVLQGSGSGLKVRLGLPAPASNPSHHP